MLQLIFNLVSAARASRTEAGSKETIAPLAGESFLDQEPDLAKESGLYTRQNSGWAMGSHTVLD